MSSHTQRKRALLVAAMGLAGLFLVSRSADATITWKSGCEWYADWCEEISSEFCEIFSGECQGPPMCNEMHLCINYEEHVQAVTIRCSRIE